MDTQQQWTKEPTAEGWYWFVSDEWPDKGAELVLIVSDEETSDKEGVERELYYRIAFPEFGGTDTWELLSEYPGYLQGPIPRPTPPDVEARL